MYTTEEKSANKLYLCWFLNTAARLSLVDQFISFIWPVHRSTRSWYIKALLFMTLSIQNFTSNVCVILLLFYRIFLGSQRLFGSLLDCVRKVLILAIFNREKPLVSPSLTIILHFLNKINENHRVLHGIFVLSTEQKSLKVYDNNMQVSRLN